MAKDKAQGPAEAGDWDLIAFEVKSWGRSLNTWRIGPGGAGSWTETVETPGATAMPVKTVYHLIEAGDAGFDRISAIVARLPDPPPDADKCTHFMPDAAYGTIRLTKGSTTTEIAWNSGCLDEDYLPFVATLKEADQQMREWGKAGKVLRTE